MSLRDIFLRLSVETNPAKRAALYADMERIQKGLKKVEDQANDTRQAMQKIANVGQKMALAGAAILAPFALAMKKYMDTVKDTEPVSRRILELNKKWEESQVRLGRVTATIILPALEAGAEILENVIAFAEKNPGVVQAALTIGTTLVVLGGLITTTAQLVSAIATIQEFAGAAALVGGGGATAGAGALTAGAAGIITAIAPAAVFALALAIGGNVGLAVGNALAGTNQTWSDILLTVQQMLVLNALAFDNVVRFFGGQSNLEGIVSKALGISDKYVVDSNLRIAQTSTNTLSGAFLNGIGALLFPLSHIGDMLAGIGNLFRGGQASGGYATQDGLYRRGEQGREFVMNNQTTRNAERAIGGRLTQDRAATAMTNNYNIGRGRTIRQERAVVRQEMKTFKDGMLAW